MVAALLLATCLPARAGDAAPRTHFDYRAEAAAAYQKKNYEAARAAIARALELRPDSPRYLRDAAALAALTGQPAAAIAHLRRIAAMGIVVPVEREPDFATLQATPAFREVIQLMADSRTAQGEAEIVAELPGRTGIIEGIAFRGRTGDLFLSDVHHRCIWRRDHRGQVTRFTAEDDELLGILGLALDEPRNSLWAAMTALPEMAGYTPDLKGRAALAEFNLTTGELRQIVEIPNDGRDHGIGDVLVAPDGTVFASDSIAPVVWQWSPGTEDVEKACETRLFSSLQGMVLVQRTLVVADYSNGLFAIDLSTRNVTALVPPPNTTLLGIDGLAAVPDGLVAVQNGVTPQRLLRVSLSADAQKVTGVSVVASGIDHLTDLTLVTVVNDRPTFIAGSGWDLMETSKSRTPPSHTVRVFQALLPVR